MFVNNIYNFSRVISTEIISSAVSCIFYSQMLESQVFQYIKKRTKMAFCRCLRQAEATAIESYFYQQLISWAQLHASIQFAAVADLGQSIQEWTMSNWWKTAFKKFEGGMACLKRTIHHTASNFLKAVFHKFYLVASWILCPIYHYQTALH